MMDDVSYQLVLILVALSLVFLNGFFVASEFAIVKVRNTRVEEMIQLGAKGARRCLRLVNNMDEYLAVTQFGITLASLGLGWIGEPAFARLFEPMFEGLGVLKPVLTHSLAATVAFLLITFLHIVLGELAPKSLAIQVPERVIFSVASPMILFRKASYPFIWFLNGTANILLQLFGIRVASRAETTHSPEEFRLILAESRKKGVLDREEQWILERTLDFRTRAVRQIMVPAVEVSFLDTEKTLEQNLETIRVHRRTRYPLCQGTLDQVVGVVHVKDLFLRYRELGPDFNLKAASRPVRFVHESKLVKYLLLELRQSRTHLSIVVDEFGSTVGIVTLEDILEELVGEIQDEFETEALAPMIQELSENYYLVNGRTLLEDFEKELEIQISDDVNDTIAGHVMMILGRVARVGDEIVIAQQYRVRVVGMQNFQITELVVTRVQRPETPSP
jgi:CBS domain containing-hemolysin-like protein